MKLKIPGMDPATNPGGGGTPTPPTPSTAPIINTTMMVETAEDMLEKEELYRILHFGLPGTGKTHFGLTLPEPVCVIDTEGRAHLIVGKFKVCKECEHEWYSPTLQCPKCKSTNIRPKDIRRIQVRTMEQLYQAVDIMLTILNDVKEKTGKTGTLMIDSYTRAWIEAQNEHTKNKYGDGSTYTDVKLDPMADYKFINPRHNDLRDTILDSGFNVYFTATQGNEFGDDRFNPIGVRPEGQKHNQYAVDYFMFSFIRGADIITRIEKNSISKATPTEISRMDFNRLLDVAKSFKQQEKMITMDIMNKINEEHNAPENVPEPEEVTNEEPSPEELSLTGGEIPPEEDSTSDEPLPEEETIITEETPEEKTNE